MSSRLSLTIRLEDMFPSFEERAEFLSRILDLFKFYYSNWFSTFLSYWMPLPYNSFLSISFSIFRWYTTWFSKTWLASESFTLNPKSFSDWLIIFDSYEAMRLERYSTTELLFSNCWETINLFLKFSKSFLFFLIFCSKILFFSSDSFSCWSLVLIWSSRAEIFSYKVLVDWSARVCFWRKVE